VFQLGRVAVFFRYEIEHLLARWVQCCGSVWDIYEPDAVPELSPEMNRGEGRSRASP